MCVCVCLLSPHMIGIHSHYHNTSLNTIRLTLAILFYAVSAIATFSLTHVYIFKTDIYKYMYNMFVICLGYASRLFDVNDSN